MDGLDVPPYPGAKGLDVFENISKQAWQEWQTQQTMLINEKELNMMDVKARKYLNEQMENFFLGKDYEKAEGYTPASNKPA